VSMKTAPWIVYSFLVVSIAFFLGSVFFAGVASAATVIKQQATGSTAISVNDGSPRLGTGLSGTMGLFQISMAVANTSSRSARVTCFTDVTYSAECGGGANGEYNITFDSSTGLIGDSVQRFYSSTVFDRTLTFDATKYYQINGIPSSSTTYGTSTKTTSLSYAIYDDGSSPSASGINSISSPISQSVVGVFASLTYSYTNLGLYTVASAVIIDLTSNASIAVTAETISANGTFTYSEPMGLYLNHLYSVQPYIADGNGVRIYGPTVFFSTGTNQLPSISSVDNSNATSTLASSTVAFWNIAGLFVTRVPFGYLWDIADIYSNASSSATEFAGLSIGFGAVDPATSTALGAILPTTVSVFSTSTVTSYLSPTILGLFNALASAALYVTLMVGIFYRVKGIV